MFRLLGFLLEWLCWQMGQIGTQGMARATMATTAPHGFSSQVQLVQLGLQDQQELQDRLGHKVFRELQGRLALSGLLGLQGRPVQQAQHHLQLAA
jgi:hypothetical protein